jgi:hypothetical protein
VHGNRTPEENAENSLVSSQSGAESGALAADLARIVAAWPRLSDKAKAAIQSAARSNITGRIAGLSIYLYNVRWSLGSA